MKRHPGLVLLCLGIASMTCSHPDSGDGLPDSGVPDDLGLLDAGVAPRDLGRMLADLGPPSDASAPDAPDAAGAGRSLNFVAGWLGGPGHADDTGRFARFNVPFGLAADGAGNLYVANTYYNSIRKVVVATGVVSTLTCPHCNYPASVVSDGANTLYVANQGDSTLLTINLTTGIISTLAGVAGQSGLKVGPLPARFNKSSALALVPTGELVIMDEVEHAVTVLR